MEPHTQNAAGAVGGDADEDRGQERGIIKGSELKPYALVQGLGVEHAI